MDWIRITLDTRAEHTDLLSDCLTQAGAIAVTLKSGGETALYEPAPGEVPLWGEIQVEGLFEPGTNVEAVIQHLRDCADDAQIIGHHSASLADQPWERACLDAFHPTRFGDRTWICPSWENAPADPDAVIIDLDPGLAFGTGSHATTALCLEWLDRHPMAGLRVIDYGCGSGVLAIAAAKHGAARAWAVDHDPQALAATAANARKNRVEQIITPCPPERLDAPPADVLLANILAGPLMALAPRFADSVRPQGTIVLSGVLADQARALTEAYQPWFHITATLERDGWLLVEGRRWAGRGD